MSRHYAEFFFLPLFLTNPFLPAVFNERLFSLHICRTPIFPLRPFFSPKVKQEENEAALLLLSKRLKELDMLPWEQRQLALIEGIIAGNVFDWGAKEVSK